MADIVASCEVPTCASQTPIGLADVGNPTMVPSQPSLGSSLGPEQRSDHYSGLECRSGERSSRGFRDFGATKLPDALQSSTVDTVALSSA